MNGKIIFVNTITQLALSATNSQLKGRVANLYWSSDAIPAIQIMPFYAFFCKIENYAVLFHF